MRCPLCAVEMLIVAGKKRKHDVELYCCHCRLRGPNETVGEIAKRFGHRRVGYKLDATKVRQIRALAKKASTTEEHGEERLNQRKIAQAFNISLALCNQIINRKRWAHVR